MYDYGLLFNLQLNIMSFGGSVSAMVPSLKNNKRSRRSTFDKLKAYEKVTVTKVKFENTATPEQLKEIRERLQKENRKNRIITLTTTISIVIILFLVFYYVKF